MFNSVFFILTNSFVRSTTWHSLPTLQIDTESMPPRYLPGQDSPSFGPERREIEEEIDLEATRKTSRRGDEEQKSPIETSQTLGSWNLIPETAYPESNPTIPQIYSREQLQEYNSPRSEATTKPGTGNLTREALGSVPGSRQLCVSSGNDLRPSSGNWRMGRLPMLALGATVMSSVALGSALLHKPVWDDNITDTPQVPSTTYTVSTWSHLPVPSTTSPTLRIQSPEPYKGPFPPLNQYSPICQSHARWLAKYGPTIEGLTQKVNEIASMRNVTNEDIPARLAYYIGHSDDPNRKDCQIVS